MGKDAVCRALQTISLHPDFLCYVLRHFYNPKRSEINDPDQRDDGCYDDPDQAIGA
jgi:hypothetical protein